MGKPLEEHQFAPDAGPKGLLRGEFSSLNSLLFVLGAKRADVPKNSFEVETVPMIHHPEGGPVDQFLKAHPARGTVQNPVAPH